MNPADLAERATLGALLAEPAQLPTVAGWLRPSDFAHWWHTAIYRALLLDPVLARRGDPVATAQHVRAVLVERLGHGQTDAPRLHTLLQAAPAHPVAARYAAMVLEASIRRQVAALGVHLLAAATRVPDTSNDRPRPAVTAERLGDLAGLVGPVVADLAQQWSIATSAVTDGATAAGAPAGWVDVAADDRRVARLRDLAVAADRAVGGQAVRDPTGVRRDQARLVAALVSRPDRIEPTAAWLRPEQVARPARAVYEALLALRQDGAPVDPVTIAWEVHRASRARGPGPDPILLLRQVESARMLDFHQLTATVGHDVLRCTATTAADGLRAAAANPGLMVGDLLDAATRAAEAVTRTATTIATSTHAVHHPQPATTYGAVPPACAGRWRRPRHLTPVPDGPDLTVVR